MLRNNASETFTRLREYDSLSSLLKKSFPKSSFSFPWHKAKRKVLLRCFDAQENFIVLGWNNGALSVVERNCDANTHIFWTGIQRDTLLGAKGETFATWLTIRETDHLIIVCSCVCDCSKVSRYNARLSEMEQSIILVYRIPLNQAKKLIMSKMVRHVVRGIHHNPVSAPLYVSPAADIIISGDSRGSVVHSRYSTQLSVYHSYVLTVVPGSLQDLKLIQGSLLLLTCRAFPKDCLCDEDDTIEVLQEPEALHFLFDIASRKLTKLNLGHLLPPELNLRISPTGIVWLPKQGLSKELRFMCAIKSVNLTHSTAGINNKESIEDRITGVVAAVFTVYNHSAVSLERLILIQPESFSPTPVCIPVLTSAVSAATVSLLPSSDGPVRSSSMTSVEPVPSRRTSCASSLSSNHPTATNGIQDTISLFDRRIALYSDSILILWFSESPSCNSTMNSYAGAMGAADGAAEPMRSTLAFIQLDPFPSLVDAKPSTSTEPVRTTARLLAYSNQLGPITLLSVVPIRPWSGPLLPCANSLSLWPTGTGGPRGGNGGLGVEVWIQRTLPNDLQDGTPTLLLLSTRPLCTSRLALSPSADLQALFTDQKHDWMTQSMRNTSQSPSKSPEIERGLDAVELMVDVETCEVVKQSVTPDISLSGEHDPNPMDDEEIASPASGQDEEKLCSDSPPICTLAREFTPPPLPPPSPLMSSSQVGAEALNGTQPEIEDALTSVEDAPDYLLDQVDSQHITQTDEPDSMPGLSETDGRLFTSCRRRRRASQSPLGRDSSSTLANMFRSNDTWSVFACPSSQTITSTQSDLELALSDPGAELMALVPNHSDDRPVLVVYSPERTGKLESVVAPKSFGRVNSLHVSPDGQIVWCLRKSISFGANEVDGCMVDVSLESGGVRGLAQRWLHGQSGKWESDVLRRVVSVDLGNHRAVFITSSGDVKIQFGLSGKRPYCQSYTWSCPQYHVLQIAVSPTGLVWALALTRSDDQTDCFTVQSGTRGELCLLSAFLPSLLDSSQSGTASSAPPSPQVIKSQLKSSHWIPLSMPNHIQPGVNEFFNERPTSFTMTQLATMINATFQLMLTKQERAFGPVPPAEEEVPDAKGYTMGWLICTASRTVDVHGCGFFLPNLNPPYKADDAAWCEIAFECPEATALTKSGFLALMKRINSGFPPTLPMVRIMTRVVLINNRNQYTNPPALCSTPLWVQVNHSGNSVTLLKRLRSSLPVYRWSKYRLRLGPRVQPMPSSAIHDADLAWRFPLLVDRTSSVGSKTRDYHLWTLSSRSNEFFYHSESKHPRSLPIPSSNERDEVVATCVVRDEVHNTAHLIVATQSGCLWSRLGLSDLAPVGTTWVAESVPNHWVTDLNQPTAGDSQSRDRTYCTSAAYIDGELWITDSTGTLTSTRVELVHNDDGTQQLLSPNWIVHSSPLQLKRDWVSHQIHFLSVSGHCWKSRGQGNSIWALGMGIKEARKLQKLSTPLPDGVLALVYSRCWNSELNCFVWSHVPAPPARSVQVTEDNVWLVSSTEPRQIYLRVGLRKNSINSHSNTAEVPGQFSAPSELQIGHAWQSVPLPDPVFHTLNVDWVVAVTDKTNAHLNGGQRLDALILTRTGVWLCLRILGEILTLGPPIPTACQPKSSTLPDGTDLIELHSPSPSNG